MRSECLNVHRPLDGPFFFRAAIFKHGVVPENSPLAFMGGFASLMGRFPTSTGVSPSALMGRFPSWKSLGKQPIKKRPIKRFLKCAACGKSKCYQILAPRCHLEAGSHPSPANLP